MLRDQEKNKDDWHNRIHTESKVEKGRTYSNNEEQQVSRPNAAQTGNQGEGRDQEDDQAEDGKTT